MPQKSWFGRNQTESHEFDKLEPIGLVDLKAKKLSSEFEKACPESKNFWNRFKIKSETNSKTVSRVPRKSIIISHGENKFVLDICRCNESAERVAIWQVRSDSKKLVKIFEKKIQINFRNNMEY
jgi:hypothetical protein